MTHPIEFEWDEAKNRANQRKHGYSFEEAPAVLERAETVELIDDADLAAEERIIAVGEVRNRLVVVVFTEPGEDRIRIISMRPADKREAKLYQDHQDRYG